MATVGLILRIVFLPIRVLVFTLRMITYALAAAMILGALLGLWRSGFLF